MSNNGKRSHIPIRPFWLATCQEEALQPGQRIIDAHHHLFDRPGWRYLLDDLLVDIGEGHNVQATVYVQGRAMLRTDGPEIMRPIGETEFANGVAAMSESGSYGDVRVCAGIVGFADLLRGDAVRPVLEAHLAAAGAFGEGPGRFRGIRHIAVWDPDPAMVNPAYQPTENMLESAAFRTGFAHLSPLGLSFDAWLLFHQIPHLARLARAFPETQIVLDHCGGIAGIGAYAGKRDEVFSVWSAGISDLAKCPNVMVKLGGLGLGLSGFGFEQQPVAPSSAQLAATWRPYMETVLDAFGTDRCMFESNFPIDKGSYSYSNGWNAMKRIAENFNQTEKDDLFWRSAARFYRLPVDAGMDSARHAKADI
ncbi:amidohydrolase family protein (plasmid) [Rhizobium leguminosarum]|uniref:amidohydrolase family protein n=1 Tax=Rhizobium leguminosarum TaxID=384 RepID=UPI00103EB4C8|nr:amidohydrolase family protein [Rhizobium leguminosarum]MBY5496031.1 amidohydrolase family protein [Rhizobium leguminosarum]TCA16500.1 amidohydrolase [Rhizobium leguminosarum bv. viciae]TCA43170.1 amidohydrolase [Rhizobium leguminosarum bv. viciae]